MCIRDSNRYSTSGAADNHANIQPFLVHYRDGNLALAHNGNISNAREIRNSFIERGTLFQSTADSELVLHLISQSTRRKQIDQITDAVSQLEGAFSLAIMTDEALIALRDPNGFRPLAIGRIPAASGNPSEDAWCVASETCAFDLVGAEYVRDVRPGELIVINQKGIDAGSFESYQLAQNNGVSQCVFEYICLLYTSPSPRDA